MLLSFDQFGSHMTILKNQKSEQIEKILNLGQKQSALRVTAELIDMV